MSGQINPNQPDFEEASLQLNKGLKSCQAVVRNYRAMLENPLGGEDSLAPDTQPEATEDRKNGD